MSKHHHHDHCNYYDYPQHNFNIRSILGKIIESLFTNFLSSKGLLKNNDGYENNGGGLLNTLLSFTNGFNNNNYRGDSMSNNTNSKNHKNDKNHNTNTPELGDTLNSILQNIDMNQILQILASNTSQNNNRNQKASSADVNGQNPLAALLNGLASPEILEQLTEAINKTKNNK